MSDIDRANAQDASGRIAPDELIPWATLLLLNDAYTSGRSGRRGDSRQAERAIRASTPQEGNR